MDLLPSLLFAQIGVVIPNLQSSGSTPTFLVFLEIIINDSEITLAIFLSSLGWISSIPADSCAPNLS